MVIESDDEKNELKRKAKEFNIHVAMVKEHIQAEKHPAQTKDYNTVVQALVKDIEIEDKGTDAVKLNKKLLKKVVEEKKKRNLNKLKLKEYLSF